VFLPTSLNLASLDYVIKLFIGFIHFMERVDMAKLGTKKRLAVVRVQTEERMLEIASIFEEHGWKFIIGLEPDKPEDISDLERLLNPPVPHSVGPKMGRNDPCLCGSGRKYKKCCGK
jgi:SWIM/SEC-C metal-binding protein